MELQFRKILMMSWQKIPQVMNLERFEIVCYDINCALGNIDSKLCLIFFFFFIMISVTSISIILTFLLANNKFLRRIQVLDEAAAAQTASHKLGKVTPPPQNGR